MYVSSQQNQHLQQMRQVMTHPFFTGKCPQCEQQLQLVDRVIGQSHCSNCGWTDEAED